MQRALGAQDGACDKIVIPFFSLFVKDLYFLNEGCRNKLGNGYINFQVCTNPLRCLGFVLPLASGLTRWSSHRHCSSNAKVVGSNPTQVIYLWNWFALAQ